MNPLIKNTIIIAAFLLIAGNLFADDLKILKEKSIPVNSDGKIIVVASGADIKVEGWDKEEAFIRIYGNEKAESKMKFSIEKDDNGVIVLAKRKSSFFSWGSGIKVKIDVRVPKKYNVRLETSGGDLFVKDISGAFKYSTSGGDINIENTSGKLVAETSGGDININNHYGESILGTSGGDIETYKVTGNIKAETSGGDIKIEVKDAQVFAETSGGDIRIMYYGTNKGIHAETSGGDINVKIPTDFRADAYLNTSGGSVDVNVKTSDVDVKKRSEFKGKINDGGPKLELETSGGDISLDY